MLCNVVVFLLQLLCLSHASAVQRRSTKSSLNTVSSSNSSTDSITGFKNLWMDSIMLRHTLHWDSAGPTYRYTVYTTTYEQPWQQVVTCTNISSTYCSLSKQLNFFITYDFKVETEPQKEALKYKQIKFCAEQNTTLLPPSFTAIRQGDKMFIHPSTPTNLVNNQSILQKYPDLEYEVKYWNQNNSDDITRSIAKNTEIPIQGLNTSTMYCISMRLYNFNGQFGDALYSNWSESQCFDAIPDSLPILNHPQHRAPTLIIVVASIIGLVVVVVIAYFAWKLHKYFKAIGPLPDNLVKAMKELDADQRQGGDQLDSTSENVYLLPENNEVQLPPSSGFDTEFHTNYSRTLAALATFYELCVLQPNSDTKPKVYDFEEDDLWMDVGGEKNRVGVRRSLDGRENEVDFHDRAIAAFRFRKPRQRSVSRGYHSASSDDVISDVTSHISTISFDDNKSDFDYVQTDALFDGPSNTNSEVFNDVIINDATERHFTFQHIPQLDNYVKEIPTRSPYTQMLTCDYPYANTMQIFTLSKKRRPNINVQHRFYIQDIPPVYEKGNCNYENLTYCSNVYGDIPDALLDDRALSMSL